MKRMLCFISDMILPNFIPLNEAATKPDVLHAIFTPSEERMKKRLKDLKTVVKAKFPNLKIEEVEIPDAYDGKAIYESCKTLVEDYPNDDWKLNSTGGTKLMSSPAIEFFREAKLEFYYVETFRNRILSIKPDWEISEIPFNNSISIEEYFQLHGHIAKPGKSINRHEIHIFNQLQKLNWTVEASVRWRNPDNTSDLAEYDMIGIHDYQMSVFECKRKNSTDKEKVLKDLLKLSQIKYAFGGPFGKIYWIFNGQAQIGKMNEIRIKEFGIKLISGDDVNQISNNPQKFGLPPIKKLKNL